MTITPESDEVAGHHHGLAQANRIVRFCQANGVDLRDFMAGRVELNLDPICDAHGEVAPEASDYDFVRRSSTLPSEPGDTSMSGGDFVKKKLAELVEIRVGEFKPLGECRADDLRAAEKLCRQRAAALEAGENPE